MFLTRALGIAWLVPSVSSAATFCVDTNQEIQQALTTAAANGESDVVRIQSGNYTGMGGSAAFSYLSGRSPPSPSGAAGVRTA